MKINSWQEEYRARLTTADEAVRAVKSGDHVYIGTCSSVAVALAEALGRRSGELEDITICGSNLFPDLEVLSGRDPAFSVHSFFMGPRDRAAVKNGFGDYTSVHLSEVDQWCLQTEPPDVAFFEVSEPDADGYMSYGATGVCLHTYLKESARRIILQVNPNAPYVYGEQNLIHVTEADALVEAATPLAQTVHRPAGDTERAISRLLVDRIPDGACLQLGIGSLSDTVGYGLKDKNDLGIHSELMTESLMFLMKNGNVTNRRKSWLPGKSVVSFSLGTDELYRFLDHNRDIWFQPMPVLNDVRNIAKNDGMISVNTAMSIDLMGQVVADNIGGLPYSGVGGQLDFVRGAQLARGGKSFLAVTSTLLKKDGTRLSRIVPTLAPGTAVTTTRADVQYVVTEYGCVNLKTLNMKDRVRALIGLAHPDFRDGLTDEARRLRLL